MSLTLIVPSKGRPDNARRLIQAVNRLAGEELTELVIALDHDEPLLEEYQAAVPVSECGHEWSWVSVHPVRAQPQRMGPVLNAVAEVHACMADYVAFMGDDHLPRTHLWDELLVDALRGRPGVAYGNDLVQGETLPTACVISSDIIRALGYMCPPGQQHLYLDNFWRLLGTVVGNLAYCPDVVIEHLHPTAGTAGWDDSYLRNNAPDQYIRDRSAYQAFLRDQWPDDLTRLKDELGL